MTFKQTIEPDQVRNLLGKHIQTDGFDMVMDLERSKGAYMYDKQHDRYLLDFFSHIATLPLGYNHPKLREDEAFKQNLFEAALANPVNSDVYTELYAHFLETFERVGIPSYLHHAFFIAGGSLAVENALKVAMDWKVQKNFEKGYRCEMGKQVIHFDEAFHGRSGYTLSMTNTEPHKTQYFTKFNWPRIQNPKIHFPYTDENYEDLLRREQLAIRQIKMAFQQNRDDICAIIIEPIQSEGGDNHFRTEFMEELRALCDENDALLIYDEVQTGVGGTGKFWAHEHFGENARPDIIAFGKKMQVCGILAGPRIDEVPHNCFQVPSRINSTWGGNLVDMVRADKILQIIEEDDAVGNAERSGAHLQKRLQELQDQHPHLTNARGKGLLCAIDLPTREQRDHLIQRGRATDVNVLFLGCGSRTVRFRPTLTIQPGEIDEGIDKMEQLLKEMHL
jgi:L-lysine 6-transaminase